MYGINQGRTITIQSWKAILTRQNDTIRRSFVTPSYLVFLYPRSQEQNEKWKETQK